MNKVLMLLQSEFPPDIRLEKEIKSFSNGGFDVTLLCNQYNKEKNSEYPGVTLFRIPAVSGNIKINKLLNFPLFANPRFLWYAIKAIKKFKPDFLHVHDLPMAPLGWFLNKLFGIPTILDLHEVYPEALKSFNKKGLINFIFKNYRLARILEKWIVHKFDKLVVVVEESKSRLVKMGVPAEKVHVVSNTVDLDTFDISENFREIDLEGKPVLIYSGLVGPDKGLDTPVRGMKYLREYYPEAKLYILGEGPDKPRIEKIIADENISGTQFLPWQGHEIIPSYLNASDICIMVWPSNSFTDTTIPHKLFEYMSQGKKVIVSDAKPLKRIIDETGAGEVFKSNNPQSFADTIKLLYESDKNYGQNGIKAVQNKYNWRVDSEELLNLYNELKERSKK